MFCKNIKLTVQLILISRHEADRLEQEARGRLERQKIQDEAEAEKARRELLELQAQSAAVESTGQAKAEAQSRAEAARIEGEAAVQQATLKAQAQAIEAVSERSFNFLSLFDTSGQNVKIHLLRLLLCLSVLEFLKCCYFWHHSINFGLLTFD